MITPIDLPVVLSQAPLAQQMQFAAQSAPSAHQAFLSHLVLQKHQREGQQVIKTEKSEPASNSIRDRSARDGSAGGQSHHKQEHEEEHPDIPEQSDHILDIKV